MSLARDVTTVGGAMTAGQVFGSAVIAMGMSIGYPAFALLFAASGAARVAAWRMARPTDSHAPAVTAQTFLGHEKTAEAEATAVV